MFQRFKEEVYHGIDEPVDQKRPANPHYGSESAVHYCRNHDQRSLMNETPYTAQAITATWQSMKTIAVPAGLSIFQKVFKGYLECGPFVRRHLPQSFRYVFGELHRFPYFRHENQRRLSTIWKKEKAQRFRRLFCRIMSEDEIYPFRTFQLVNSAAYHLDQKSAGILNARFVPPLRRFQVFHKTQGVTPALYQKTALFKAVFG